MGIGQGLVVAVGGVVVGLVIFVIFAFISGFLLSIAWNSVMEEIFPRVKELGVPLVITWWQGFKISFFLGLIGGKFGKSSVETKSE